MTRPSFSATALFFPLLSLFLCVVGALPVAAQDAPPLSRDPTLAPTLTAPATESAVVSAPDVRVARTLALVSGPLTLIERDGRRYVLIEGHLYAEGEHFGAIHIERVRETEVWFRDGTATYKMSRFPGVERRLHTFPP